MSKLSYKDKISIYRKREEGKTIKELSIEYSVSETTIKYLVRLIDMHGSDIIKPSKNRYYSIEEKRRIINRILINNESIWSVAIDEGLLSKGLLVNWIKNYKENDYNIVERKRGRNPTMLKKAESKKINETLEEENERLKRENEYLRAELEYSKKLRAVVQTRKNRQQKKK